MPPADLFARVRTLRPQDPSILAGLRAGAQHGGRAAEPTGAGPCGVDEAVDAPPPRGGPVADVRSLRGDAGSARDPLALDDLPGAGPGLIWKLRQTGVSSLRDLAHADPVELGRRLGPVGKLVAVGPWIAFARRRLLEQVD